MTNSKKKDTAQKPKIEISRRETSGKKKPDLFAKFRNTEHPLDTLIPIEVNSNPTPPYPSIASPTPPYPTLPHPTPPYDISNPQSETSPAKNFTKVSNSVVKQAIPDGLFRGQSKHTYDVLYLKTRGAIVPKREIQLTKSELVEATGLGIKTIQRHLSYLKDTELIKIDQKNGDHKGAIYEIFIPEELDIPYPTIPYPTLVDPGIKPTPLPGLKCGRVGYGKIIENKEDNLLLKTSFKTNTNDDDYARTLNEYCLKITGRDLTEKDKKEFVEVIKVLGAEILMARARTGNISSFVPFMLSHIKSKFATGRNPADVKKGSEAKHDRVGEQTDEINLENELLILRDLIELEGIEAIEKWRNNYTEKDWNWLKKNLEK